ncbi:MAG: ribosome biogenesis GTPase Der [Planctomycetota bacterium]|nr:ribosome biogenesis GTPase Der [Planctomycetota bacterium]
MIAIIGRPNVGKSSLFNRIARRRISIVDPTPGVTRDQLSVSIELQPPEELEGSADVRWVELCDTAGFGVYSAEGKQFDDAGEDLSKLTPRVEEQIRRAAHDATIILFVIDAQHGVTGLDRQIGQLLRASGYSAKVILVANKVDSESWEAHAYDATSMGFGNAACVSAMNGGGLRQLAARLWTIVGESSAKEPSSEMKLAIVGRRNAGKSSLVNALAGQDRVIVSEIAGTTRDSVDVRFEANGRSFLAIDTAGVRKQRSFADDIEFYASTRTEDAIRRADVCLLLLDATEKISQVEKKLSGMLVELHKPVILVVNKWDLVDRKLKLDDYSDYLTQEFPHLDFAPIVTVSAVKGEGLEQLVTMAFNLFTQASHREGTGRLNAVMQEILKKRGPSSALGTIAKIFYVTQIATKPPTIAVVVNKPKLFTAVYQRYIINRLREELAFSEVPISLVISERKRRESPGDRPVGKASKAASVESNLVTESDEPAAFEE